MILHVINLSTYKPRSKANITEIRNYLKLKVEKNNTEKCIFLLTRYGFPYYTQSMENKTNTQTKGNKMTEQSFLAQGKNFNIQKLEIKGIKSVAYTYRNYNDKPCLIAFRGNRKARPVVWTKFNDVFRRDEIAADWMNTEVYAEKVRKEVRAEKLELKKEFISMIKVGTIFYSSWGYDQTNVSFYQVISKDKCRVELRELNQECKPADGFSSMSGYATPLKNDFVQRRSFWKMITQACRINLDSSESIKVWDGKPQYKSWYA